MSCCLRRPCSFGALPTHQSGLSLVEIALTLTLAGALVAVGAVSSRGASSESGEAAGVSVRNDFERWGFAVQGFAATRHRLPCPDSNGDGLEDCDGAVVGTMPYRTLELPTAALDGYGRPLRYAASVTLQSSAELDGPSWQPSGRNREDFCAALRSRLAAGYVHGDLAVAAPTLESCDAATSSFVAYALVSSGAANADNDVNGDPFDRAHSLAGACVMAPSKSQTDDYDDAVHSVGVAELAGWICK